MKSFLSALPQTLLRTASLLCLCGGALTMSPAMAATKIAFIGDQGTGGTAKAVLSMIKDEGADAVLIQGDLGYFRNTAREWEDNLTNTFGANFPVLAVVGNHENYEWPLYKRFIERRLGRTNSLSCTGDIGVKASCRMGDIQIVQVAPAIFEVDGVKARDNYPQFIKNSFANSDATWRICSWHKNQKDLQVAVKQNSVGWDAYNACLEAGAMVVNGHAHSYSRTHLLSDYERLRVASSSSNFVLKPGTSFTVVSGLGGHDIKTQSNSGDWFASVYTASQGATHGAFFCDYDGNAASCYFKAIDGSVPDQFSMTSSRGSSQRNPDRADPRPPIVPVAPIDPGSDADDIDLSNLVAGVFSRTDKKEFRWIAPDRSGEWGNIWIEESCVEKLGGVSYRGDWVTLVGIAPAWDAIANPCLSLDNSPEPPLSEQPPVAPRPPSTPNVDQDSGGYVFSRTDKREFRWIATNATGQVGSVWIDEACVQQLGGVKATGNWRELNTVAPALDSLSNPCTASSDHNQCGTSRGGSGEGYVFARTDRPEYRWIAPDSTGTLSSVWIDEACVANLGGIKQRGDWFRLREIAPAFDTISSPCC